MADMVSVWVFWHECTGFNAVCIRLASKAPNCTTITLEQMWDNLAPKYSTQVYSKRELVFAYICTWNGNQGSKQGQYWHKRAYCTSKNNSVRPTSSSYICARILQRSITYAMPKELSTRKTSIARGIFGSFFLLSGGSVRGKFGIKGYDMIHSVYVFKTPCLVYHFLMETRWLINHLMLQALSSRRNIEQMLTNFNLFVTTAGSPIVDRLSVKWQDIDSWAAFREWHTSITSTQWQQKGWTHMENIENLHSAQKAQ